MWNDGLGIGIGLEADVGRERVSKESVVSESGDGEREEGGLYAEVVAVNSSKDESETRVG